ncbi:MAG: superoxide dismutase [Chloroflexi bacterium]|nr:superoxide dismutase [Chloroflexota bacterium]
MRRWLSVSAALVAMPLIVAPALAAPPFPSQIDLPDGWMPEGITAGRGLTAYVGSLADGGIAEISLRTGVVDEDFVESATGPAVGIDYEAGAHRIWVAGGPSGQVRVYGASTGDLLETYAFEAGFINDITVTPDAAYATDSFMPQILAVPLGAGGSLPDPADAFTVDIQPPFVFEAGFNANGIVEFAGWLLVPKSGTGQLFAIDPQTGQSVEILPAGSITFADGLELVGSTLFVVRNQLARIDAYSIHGGLVTFLGEVPTDGLNLSVPTTAAFAGGQLWAANARFGATDNKYWITRVPLH